MVKTRRNRWSSTNAKPLKDIPATRALFAELRQRFKRKYTKDDKTDRCQFIQDWKNNERIKVAPPSKTSIDNFKKENCFSTCEGDLNCYCILLLEGKTIAEVLTDTPEYKQKTQNSPQNSIISNDTLMGVEQICSNKSPQDILELIARNNPKHIWFFGTHFNVNLSYKQELILRLLAQGTTLSFLFLNPLQPELAKLQHQGFGITTTNTQDNCKKSLENLISVMKIWKSQTKEDDYFTKIRAKITNNIPRLRAYIVDPHDTTATSYIIPYMNHISAGESPVMVCKNVENGLSLRYFKGIQREWNNEQTYSIQRYIEKITKQDELEMVSKEVNFKDFIAKYFEFLNDYPESEQ